MMFALFTEDAEKTDKASAVNIFRDELIAGSIGIVNGPCNDAWRAEAAKCGWDKKKLSHDPDADDHALDSGIYGHRALRCWPQNESTPEDESDEARAARQEAEWFAKRVRAGNRHNNASNQVRLSMGRR